MPGIIPVRERGPDGRPVLEGSVEPSSSHSDGDGQAARDADAEKLLLLQEGVAIVLGDASSSTSQEEPGTVYVTDRRLIWLSSLDPNRGLAVPLVSLAMHAICRDTQAYPRPCIYAQVDSGMDDDDEENDDWDDGDEEEGVEGDPDEEMQEQVVQGREARQKEEGRGDVSMGEASERQAAGGSDVAGGDDVAGRAEEQSNRAATSASASASAREVGGGGGGAVQEVEGVTQGARERETGQLESQLEQADELRLVPASEEALEALFKALSAAAALNPGPQEREGEGDWFFNAEEVAAGHLTLGAPSHSAAILGNGSGNGRSNHMVELGDEVSGRFDDAEEGEEEEELEHEG